jgi:hypothetical protein
VRPHVAAAARVAVVAPRAAEASRLFEDEDVGYVMVREEVDGGALFTGGERSE